MVRPANKKTSSEDISVAGIARKNSSIMLKTLQKTIPSNWIFLLIHLNDSEDVTVQTP